MRILQLHSNFIVFKPVEKEIAMAEEAKKEENRVEDVVVLFTAIEEGDDAALAQKAINDVHAFLEKLKVNRILIYPFAHLSSNLSKPSEALKLIKTMEAYAKQKGIETYRLLSAGPNSSQSPLRATRWQSNPDSTRLPKRKQRLKKKRFPRP